MEGPWAMDRKAISHVNRGIRILLLFLFLSFYFILHSLFAIFIVLFSPFSVPVDAYST